MNFSNLFKIDKIRFINICILVVLETLCATSVTYLMTPAFNYIKQNKLNLFLIFIALSATLQFISIILGSTNTILYNQQVQEYIHQIRNNISKYLFVKGNNKVSEIQNNLNANMQELTSKYTSPWLTLMKRIAGVLCSIGVLFTFNWSLVVLTLILSFIGLYLPKLFEHVTSSATFKVTEENEYLLDTIEKWARGLDELRRYSSFGSYQGAIKKATSELKKSTIEDCFWGNLATAMTSFVSLAGIISLLALSIYLYATGKIVFGAVITSGIFANQIMNAITLIAESLNEIKSSKKVRQQISDLQQKVVFPIKNDSTKNINQLEINSLQVSFKNGELITYPHIFINKGEKVLLTGDSGTGKSTLFKVLLGEIKPNSGKVIYKDASGKSISPSPETIENNITMFDSKLNKQIDYILKNVELKKDIDKFPAGMETIIDLDKDNLSGGQKQKIVLARAQIHNSSILLIDEGTSAIDSKATRKILEKLLKSDQTIIMIAHNFSKELTEMFDKEIHLEKEVG